MSTYEMMVRLVTEAGLDHKLTFLDGLENPFGKEAVPSAPLVVSSDLDEDLSDYLFLTCKLIDVNYAFGLNSVSLWALF